MSFCFGVVFYFFLLCFRNERIKNELNVPVTGQKVYELIHSYAIFWPQHNWSRSEPNKIKNTHTKQDQNRIAPLAKQITRARSHTHWKCGDSLIIFGWWKFSRNSVIAIILVNDNGNNSYLMLTCFIRIFCVFSSFLPPSSSIWMFVETFYNPTNDRLGIVCCYGFNVYFFNDLDIKKISRIFSNLNGENTKIQLVVETSHVLSMRECKCRAHKYFNWIVLKYIH